MRASHLPAAQLFCILHPRAQVFPELWEVISQRTQKLYRPVPELSLNIRHPQSGMPTVRWSGQCLRTPALQLGCNEQEQMQTQLQGCVTDAQEVGEWLWAGGVGAR